MLSFSKLSFSMYDVMSMLTTQMYSSAPIEEATIVNQVAMNVPNLPDINWDYLTTVDRFTYLGTTAWPTSFVAGQVLLSQPFPGSSLFVSTLQAIPFNNFSYWHGNVRVRLEMSGNKNCSGLLAYILSSVNAPVSVLNFTTQTHAIVDASGSTVVEMEYPYNWFTDQIRTNANIVQLTIIVLSPLVTFVGSTTSIPITVSVAFPKSHFEIPRVSPIVALDAERNVRAQGNSMQKIVTNNFSARGNLTAPVEMRGDNFDAKNQIDPTLSTAVGVGGSNPSSALVPAIQHVPTAPKINSIVDTVSGYVKQAGAIKEMFTKTPRNKKMHDNSSQVATDANGNFHQNVPGSAVDASMDLIASTLDPVLVWPMQRPNMNSVANIEPVYEFRQYPGSESVCSFPDFGVDIDEMRVDYLCRIPGPIGNFTIPAGAVPGTLLFCLPICPALWAGGSGPTYNQAPAPSATLRPINWLSYIQSLCTYWTGDLEYTFLFVTNTYTTGTIKFVVTFDPDFTANTMNLAQASNQYSVTYDLSDQKKRLTLRIPFISDHRAMHTMPGTVPGTYPGPLVTGRLFCIVVNTPSATTGLPQTTVVNMLQAGGPNFQVAGIGNVGGGNLGPQGSAYWTGETLSSDLPTSNVRPQGSGDDEITTSTVLTSASAWTNEAIDLPPCERTYPIADISGERFTSFRDLLKRRWFCSTSSKDIADNVFISLSTSSMLACCPYLPLFDVYQFIRGSLRITFEVTNATQTSEDFSLGILWFPNRFDINYQSTGADFFTAYSQIVISNTFGPDFIGVSTPAFGQLNCVLTKNNPCVTIEVPYQWPDKVFPCAQMVGTMTQPSETPWGYFIVQSNSNDGSGFNSPTISAYCGFADDTRMGKLISNPIYRVSPSVNGLAPYWGGTS